MVEVTKVKFLCSLPIEEVWKTEDPLTNWELVIQSDVGSARDLKGTVVAPVDYQEFHITDLNE